MYKNFKSPLGLFAKQAGDLGVFEKKINHTTI